MTRLIMKRTQKGTIFSDNVSSFLVAQQAKQVLTIFTFVLSVIPGVPGARHNIMLPGLSGMGTK